eukprot:jgi/Botrbrau1/16220/Bobra.0066s0006.1
MGVGTRVADAHALVDAFRDLVRQREAQNGTAESRSSSAAQFRFDPVTQIHVRVSPRDAFFAITERVPAGQAAGRISAELLCPYPPGIPAVFPGELISQDALNLLENVLAAGGKVTGAGDPTLQTVSVLAEEVAEHAAPPVLVPEGPGANLKCHNRWVVQESPPRRVKQVFNREQKDVFGGWVAVRLVQNRGTLEYVNALYADYEHYCRLMEEEPLDLAHFKVIFQQRYKKMLPNSYRIRMNPTTEVLAYGGIRLVSDDPDGDTGKADGPALRH